jgi:hypothetical protein
MLISAMFSASGFSFKMEDFKWVGWVLALSIIVIELVWNKVGFNSKNLTLVALGITAYAYGIYTNVIGIATAQGADPTDSLFNMIFPLLAGIVLEVAPETLIVWGLIGEGEFGDFLGNLFNSTQQSKNMPQRSNTAVKPASVKYTPQHKPTYGVPVKSQTASQFSFNRDRDNGNNK